MSERIPRVALLVLVVGLALHNLVMALLYGAGVSGVALDVVASWKDVLLLVAIGAALAAAGSLPALRWVDRLALAYAAIVVLYALLPQGWLGGDATTRGEILALRHHLLPVAGYALGRLLTLERRWWRRVEVAVLATAAAVAVVGLFEVFLVPLQWWRDSGVPGWFSEQLGLAYRCLSGLPENWILNTGDEDAPLRRLVGPFLSPLATAYLLVVALLLLAAIRRRPWSLAVGAVVFVGLLFTHTRAGFLALAGGLVVLALVRRDWRPAALAAGSLAASVAFVAVFPSIGPTTTLHAGGAHVPPGERRCRRRLRERGLAHRGRRIDAQSPAEPQGRCSCGHAPPAGLRARERRRERLQDRDRAEGRRVDLHGDRDRHRRARARGARRVARRSARRVAQPVCVADGLGRGGDGDRPADGRPGRPVDRRRGVRARGGRRGPAARASPSPSGARPGRLSLCTVAGSTLGLGA